MSPPPFRRRRRAPARLLLWFGALLLTSLAAGQEPEFAALVNPENSVRDVPRTDLIRLFRAESRYWKGGRRVELLLPRSGSAEKDFLLRHVYKMSDAELKRYWIELVYQNKIATPPKVMPSPAVMQVVLGKQDGGLGICSTTDQRSDGPPALAIDGKRPGDPDYWLKEKKEPKDGAARGQKPRDASAAQDDDLRQRVDLLEQEFSALGSHGDTDPTFEFGSLQLRGFGDVTLGIENSEGGDGSGEFALGQLDLFMTAQLSERARFLSELVFETTEDGETVSDLERLVVSYDVGSNATFRAGRIHTALGLWNGRFHHGEWLQATIERPRIIEFEDDGGLLPVHLIGVSLEVRAPWEALGLEGFLQVGNGRGPTPMPPQAGSDANDSKCVNAQVLLQPSALPGLAIGAGLYVDDIPANADVDAGPLHGVMDEEILSAFGSWSLARTSVLGEFYSVAHDDGSTVASSEGWFVQVERQYGDWTPYARFETLTIDDADAFYDSTTDEDRVVLGLRWDFSTWNAFKLQVERGRSGDASGEDFTALRLQTAFAF